jgi:hypothetical protein
MLLYNSLAFSGGIRKAVQVEPVSLSAHCLCCGSSWNFQQTQVGLEAFVTSMTGHEQSVLQFALDQILAILIQCA